MGISIILFVIGAALLVPCLILLIVAFYSVGFVPIIPGAIGVFLILVAVTKTLRIGAFREPEYYDE